MKRFALSLLLATPAVAAPTLTPGVGLTDVKIGEQTVSVKLGDDAKALSGQLGIEHGEHGTKPKEYDFTSGPLAVKAARHGGVRTLSLNLKEAGGLRIGDLDLGPEITLVDAAARAPDCVGGGDAVVCGEGQFWFTAGADGAVSVHLATASLTTLTARWKMARRAEAPVHTLPRGDLTVGAGATIEKKEVRVGESRCEVKKETVKAMATSKWLEGYKTDPGTMGFSFPVVFEISTGCKDIVAEVYAVGDQLIAIRDGNFYVFNRR